MVERLKVAIEEARKRRAQQAGAVKERAEVPTAQDDGATALWDSLEVLEMDPVMLQRERIVTFQKSDPAHAAFDMLRTRLVKLATDQGLRRIGISSATKGCGKTVVSANLAFSFARSPDLRTVLVDLDTRSPRFSRIVGLRDRRSIRWLLNGSVPPEQYLQRVAPRLAVALNGEVTHDSAELLQSREVASVLMDIETALEPDIVLYDLPPLLAGDEAVSFVPHLDAVLLVAASGQTRPDQIEECESLLGDDVNMLGVILNKANPSIEHNYYYDYGYGYGEKD